MMPTRKVKAKSLITPPPKMIKRQRGDEHRAAGDERAAQGLIERDVHHVLERPANAQLEVLADAVEDDDGVVDGKADDGQDRRHNGGAELQA
jgi:hypothetical protein